MPELLQLFVKGERCNSLRPAQGCRHAQNTQLFVVQFPSGLRMLQFFRCTTTLHADGSIMLSMHLVKHQINSKVICRLLTLKLTAECKKRLQLYNAVADAIHTLHKVILYSGLRARR